MTQHRHATNEDVEQMRKTIDKLERLVSELVSLNNFEQLQRRLVQVQRIFQGAEIDRKDIRRCQQEVGMRVTGVAAKDDLDRLNRRLEQYSSKKIDVNSVSKYTIGKEEFYSLQR